MPVRLSSRRLPFSLSIGAGVVPPPPPPVPVIIGGVGSWRPYQPMRRPLLTPHIMRACGVVPLQLGTFGQAWLVPHRRYRVMSFGEELFSTDELLELAVLGSLTSDDLLFLADDLAPAVFEEIMLLLRRKR